MKILPTQQHIEIVEMYFQNQYVGSQTYDKYDTFRTTDTLTGEKGKMKINNRIHKS